MVDRAANCCERRKGLGATARLREGHLP